MARDSLGYRGQSLLPKDRDGHAVQTLSPGSNAALSVPNGSSDRVALPSEAEFVRIACNVDVYFEFGDSSVTASASSPLFPAGVELLEVPAGATYLAAYGIAAGGLLSVTRMGATA